MIAQPNNRIYKGVQLLLFSFLFVYILLRILNLDTLHDEMATYIFYFYQGDYIGENIQWDANNHLLNSFIGHQLYKVFGDNIAVLRLPNLFAFVLYFFGAVRLMRGFKMQWLKIAGLVALTMIPFVTEYFGNARGYGLSMGFFIWGLSFMFDYFKTLSNKHLFLGYLFLGFAVSANITLVLTSLMILFLALAAPFFHATKRNSKQRLIGGVYHVLFIIGLAPFILFGFALKKANALYYGSLDGIWDVTGKTLSKYVLFIDFDWLQIVYLLVFALLLIATFIMLKAKPLTEWFQQVPFITTLLFFGNIIAFLLLAALMEVNYPEDRTAMHLIILFLILVLFLFDHFNTKKWPLLVFAFFPISFFFHISLETSVFSPDDRMNKEFYTTVKNEIEPEHSVMIYKIMNWNWPYLESHETQKASVGLFDNPNTTLTDILVTKTTILNNPEVSRLYDTIAYHPPSTYIAFKRKQPLLKLPLDTTEKINAGTDAEYINITEAILLDAHVSSDLQLSVSGHLKTWQPRNKISLVVTTENNEGKTVRYLYYSFETTYQGQLIDNDFLHHFVLENITEEETQIKVYLWNRAFHALELKDAHCILSELKSPENESR